MLLDLDITLVYLEIDVLDHRLDIYPFDIEFSRS